MLKLLKNNKIILWIVGLFSGVMYSAKTALAQVDWGMSEAGNVSLYGPPSSVEQVGIWSVLIRIFFILLIIIVFIIGVIRLIRKIVKKMKLKSELRKKKKNQQLKEKGNIKKM